MVGEAGGGRKGKEGKEGEEREGREEERESTVYRPGGSFRRESLPQRPHSSLDLSSNLRLQQVALLRGMVIHHRQLWERQPDNQD